MEGKSTTVKLVVPEQGKTQEFEITLAECLLRMPNNGGWQLPKDSEFIFDYKNGLGRKLNKQNPARAAK